MHYQIFSALYHWKPLRFLAFHCCITMLLMKCVMVVFLITSSYKYNSKENSNYNAFTLLYMIRVHA